MTVESIEFPLSNEKTIKGSRRLAREKSLQVLVAFEISGTPLDALFSHIFYREFNFGDEEEEENEDHRILKTAEVYELEADIPIDWKEDELEFGKMLLRDTVNNKTMADEMLISFADNWELDRIALIDRLLIHLAITELLNFPNIPPKVSINEAIDISKKYSTDKSSIFINGILDSILSKLKAEGKINKTGRGLNEGT